MTRFENRIKHIEALFDENLSGEDRADIIMARQGENELWKKFYGFRTDEVVNGRFGQVLYAGNEDEVGMIETYQKTERGEKYKLKTFYPYLPEHTDVMAKLIRIDEYEDQNGARLTVELEDGEKMAFSDMDYYIKKPLYQIGQMYTFAIAALAYDCNLLYGEDSAAQVKIDDPEAKYWSKVSGVAKTKFLGKDMYRLEVSLTKSGTLFPLYVKESAMGFNPMIGDKICGECWLSGRLLEWMPNEKVNDLAEKGVEFSSWLHGFDLFCFDNLDELNDQLPAIKVKDGYILDAFECGNEENYYMKLYASPEGAEDFDKTAEGAVYDGTTNIEGMLSEEAARMAPILESHIEVEWTREGIWQAFLLMEACQRLLPRKGEAGLARRDYVFCLPEEGCMQGLDYKPEVIICNENKAVIKYAYREKNVLILATVDFIHDEDGYHFEDEKLSFEGVCCLDNWIAGLSQRQLCEVVALSWQNHNVELMATYFAKDLQYTSSWVNCVIENRHQYYDYICGKFETLEEKKCFPKIKMIERANGDYALLLHQDNMQDGDLMMTVVAEGGLIIGMHLQPQENGWKLVKEYDPVHQGHGDHWETLIDGEVSFEIIKDILETGKKVSASNILSLSECLSTKCCSLEIGENAVSSKAILQEQKDTNLLASAYPASIAGTRVRMKIENIYEWENGCEATIEAECHDRTYIFFDADYADHKYEYEIGKEYEFELTAFAYKAEIMPEKDRSFRFEGEKAIDYRKKLGEEPEYDEDGNVKPITFDMSKMVAYFPDYKWKGDAELQAPVSNVISFEFKGCEMYMIHLPGLRFDDYDDIQIPLLAKQSFFPDGRPKRNDPLRARIWLQGRMA